MAAALAYSTRTNVPAARPCTWTAIIVGLRTISPEAEACAWRGRRAGMTPLEFIDGAIAAWTQQS